MKIFTTILLLTFLTACDQTQSNDKPTDKKITRDFLHDVNMLLPNGEFTVDIMDEVTISPRRKELQEKFMQAVKANPEWFNQQQKIVEQTGKRISYDPHLGMTEAEWEEYKEFMNTMSDMQVHSSGTAKVQIIRNGDIISFKSDGKLAYLDSTTIDTKNKTVKVFEYLLPFIDTVCVTNADNVFKTAWRGYKFQFSDPEHVPMPITIPTTQEELANYSMILYGLTLGLFEKTGQTYIEISGSEISQGRRIINYKIPIVVQ